MGNPNQMRKLIENFKNYTNLVILSEQTVYKTKSEIIKDLDILIHDITHSRDFSSDTDNILNNLMYIKQIIKRYFPDNVSGVTEQTLYHILPDDEVQYFYPTLIEIIEEMFAEDEFDMSRNLSDIVYINGKIYKQNDCVIKSIMNMMQSQTKNNYTFGVDLPD